MVSHFRPCLLTVKKPVWQARKLKEIEQKEETGGKQEAGESSKEAKIGVNMKRAIPFEIGFETGFGPFHISMTI